MRCQNNTLFILFLALFNALASATVASAADDANTDLIQLSVGLLHEQDKDLRALGLEQVRSEAKGTAATKVFAEQLAKLPAEAQVGLLSALADRGDRAAREAVATLLAGKGDDAVQVAAIAALGKLGETTDVPQLMKFLTSGTNDQRSAARSSLIALAGAKTSQAILADWKSKPASERVTLIEILAARRATETIPNLLATAASDEAIVRATAMIALGQLADTSHLRGLAKAVLNAIPGTERDAAERAVVQVCIRADAENRAVKFVELLNLLPPEERLALLPTLGRLGTAAGLSVVEQELAASDAVRHAAGIRALCNWPDASVAARLVEIAKNDASDEHRVAALAALIRVAPLPDGRPDAARLELVKQVLKLCRTEDDTNRLLKRASAVRNPATLELALTYLDKPAHAAAACETIVELAHHRELREANQAAFDAALDQVLATSKDPVVKDRADRYKKGQTWTRPGAEQ